MVKQETVSCEWCGKFIAIMQFDDGGGRRAPYELFTDDKGRIVKGDDNLFALEREHKCKVACPRCGKLVILESGILYDRLNAEPNSKGAEREEHRCLK